MPGVRPGGGGSNTPFGRLSRYSLYRHAPVVNIRHIGYIRVMSRKSQFPIRKLIYLSTEMAERVSAHRFDHRIESENEAIRQLVEVGLAAQPKKKSR